MLRVQSIVLDVNILVVIGIFLLIKKIIFETLLNGNSYKRLSVNGLTPLYYAITSLVQA